MTSLDVIGFGAINYDNLLLVDRIVADGEQVVRKSSIQPGGSAANTIFGLARLGVKCGFVGAVGPDREGKRTIKDLADAGIDNKYVSIKNNTKTGKTTCISDKYNKRSIYIQPGANSKINSEDIDIDYINLSRIVHLSSFVDDSQFNLQSRLVSDISDEIHISFSPGMIYAVKGIDALSDILKKTCILFANRKEIETITKTDFLSGSRICMEAGCKYVVVTLGEGYIKDGEYIFCYITDPIGQYEITLPKKTVTRKSESTGAGDSFAAGFLYGYLNKKDIAECAILGHITAISTIKRVGSRKGLPDLSQLSANYFELMDSKL
jgi:ribokinase